MSQFEVRNDRSDGCLLRLGAVSLLVLIGLCHYVEREFPFFFGTREATI